MPQYNRWRSLPSSLRTMSVNDSGPIKVQLVLPHRVSAAGNDRAIHFTWQCLHMHADGTLQLGSGAIRSAPSSFWQKSISAARLSTCYYLTFTWSENLRSSSKDVTNKIWQILWKEEEEARCGNICRLFSFYRSTLSSNRFGCWTPPLGPTTPLFKAH